MYSLPKIIYSFQNVLEVHLEMPSTDTQIVHITGEITSRQNTPDTIWYTTNMMKHVTDYLCSVKGDVTDGLTSHLCIFFFYDFVTTLLVIGCKTWSFEMRAEHRLRMFENTVLRKIF
jgi:hypothetical protein